MSEEKTEGELHTLTIKLLMEIQIEQQMNKAYLHGIASLLLTEEQKENFRKIVKEQTQKNLQQLVKVHPSLFDESVHPILADIGKSTDDGE